MLIFDIDTAWPGDERKDAGARGDSEVEEDDTVADNGGDVVLLAEILNPATFCCSSTISVLRDATSDDLGASLPG